MLELKVVLGKYYNMVNCIALQINKGLLVSFLQGTSERLFFILMLLSHESSSLLFTLKQHK